MSDANKDKIKRLERDIANYLNASEEQVAQSAAEKQASGSEFTAGIHLNNAKNFREIAEGKTALLNKLTGQNEKAQDIRDRADQ